MNLTLPMTTWLSLTSEPGDAAGPGALDAGVCRDLAAALASNPGSRWCLTLTSPDVRATAHGWPDPAPEPPTTDHPAPDHQALSPVSEDVQLERGFRH